MVHCLGYFKRIFRTRLIAKARVWHRELENYGKVRQDIQLPGKRKTGISGIMANGLTDSKYPNKHAKTIHILMCEGHYSFLGHLC